MKRNTGQKATITAMRILAAGSVIISSCLSADTTQADSGAHCQQTALHVALSPAATTRYTIIGWLCTPTDRRAPTTAQILLSGLTYDHHYWDLPYQPDRYSYLHTALNHGNAVFTLDRLGVGRSDSPPAGDVTVASEAYVTHQIVQALRRGAVGGIRISQIVGVGHSVGAGILIYEAALWHDVDALILISYLHQPNPVQQRAIAATLYPAAQDPKFAGHALPGYQTTVPGSRLNDFYSPPFDPAVVALDEALKQTETTGERATLNLARDPTYSSSIRVPVLLVVGRHDTLACNPAAGLMCTNAAAICERETPYYLHVTSLAAIVTPGGHSIALHRDAIRWFKTANTWVAGLHATRNTPSLTTAGLSYSSCVPYETAHAGPVTTGQ
jgi:pimeloyl-ACP methyl ester carboxylesterase